MKISVIIPAYNEEAYIGETLKHVLAQKYSEPFEVIVPEQARFPFELVIVQPVAPTPPAIFTSTAPSD